MNKLIQIGLVFSILLMATIPVFATDLSEAHSWEAKSADARDHGDYQGQIDALKMANMARINAHTSEIGK